MSPLLKRWSIHWLAFCMMGIASSLLQAAELPREVFIVFKTHFDIGYTDLASNIVLRYRTSMIDQALQVVEQNRDLPSEQQFSWTIPGWPMSKITEDWNGQTPERQQKIFHAFREGRFAVHALPFTTHTELLEPEDLVRGLGYATRLARQAGLPLPRDAKMTDVPCHAWITPTLLRNARVDFLHLGCNGASSSPQIPALFWWQGPDGSRLLTMYSASGYGTGLEPPEGWPYKTWLALIHTGDNHGPPTPEEVKELLNEAKKKLPGVKIRIGRLSDFADAVLAENAPIPVVCGDMPDTWIHGPMCDPAGAKLARNIRPLLGAAESLHTLLDLWGVSLPNVSVAISKAYEQSLLYGEHTWGGAFYWITGYGSDMKWTYDDSWKADHAAGRFKRLESSWAEHTAYIETASEIIKPVLQHDLKALARSVDVSGPRLVVFNPLPWKRTGQVAIHWPQKKALTWKPVEGGPAIKSSVHSTNLCFLAVDVPPSGYRTYVPVSLDSSQPTIKADLQTGTIENRWFKLSIDPARGVIRSLWDKGAQRELVDTSSPHAFGQYLYERFDSNQVAAYVDAYVKVKFDWATNELGKPKMPPASQVPYRAVSPVGGSFDIERTATFAIATWRAASSSEVAHGITTRLVLHESEPWVDLEITLHDKPADPWPEAGWICLPFKIDSPQFRLGRPGVIIDPTQDIVRGANRHLFGIQTGVALYDSQGRGVGVCAPDNPLFSLGEPGCWKYSLDFVPKKPVLYINLFNNQWTTNFRLWNSGSWTARVRLWSFDNYQADSSLITPSLETRYPLQAFFADQAPGKLPTIQRGVELDRAGIIVTAFGRNPEGEGIVLRLWELAGNSGPCRIRVPAALSLSRIQPVDLRGRPCDSPLEIKDGEFAVHLRAFAPASFILVASSGSKSP